MKINRQHIQSSSLLAGAIGIGSIGAALFGVAGAIGGLLVGFVIGYWAEVQREKLVDYCQPNKGETVHK
ncbi:hypothetical protein GCM10027423_07460 [Spirosoma arcticum]